MTLTTRFKGEVPVSAGETTWVLCYPINSLIAMEEELGLGLTEIGAMLQDGGFDMKMSRKLFRFALAAHHPEIGTDQAAGDVMGAIGFLEAQLGIFQAFAACLPMRKTGEAAEEPSDPPPGARDGTGKSS